MNYTHLVYALYPFLNAVPRRVSSLFNVRLCAFELYGAVWNTLSFQLSSKNVCPTCMRLPE